MINEAIVENKLIWSMYTSILRLEDRLLFFLKRHVWNKTDAKTDHSRVYVNLGGGSWIRRHWKVLDYKTQHYNYDNNYIDIAFDLNSVKNGKKLPFKDNSVDLFYCSHVFEHLEDACVRKILRECFRVLKHNGGIRITGPDIDKAWNAYKNKDGSYFIHYSGDTLSQKFIHSFATPIKNKYSQKEVESLFQRKSKNEFCDFFTQQLKFNYDDADNHINWYNLEKLAGFLKEAGFKKIIPSRAHCSSFVQMKSNFILSRGRFDAVHPSMSLFIEATKN